MPDVTEDVTEETVRAELRGWLAEAWDPDLTVAEWWERLAESGWAVPTWPSEWLGRDLPRGLVSVVNEEIRTAGAIGPPAGLGMLLAGPTILAHGTDEQKERYLRPIVTGQEGLVPALQRAGRGLRPRQPPDARRARRRRVDHQRSEGVDVGGQVADLGMLLARTDP